MPCDSISTLTVEFNVNPKNKALLKKTLESLSWSYREIQSIPAGGMHIDTPQGTITILNGQATGPEWAVTLLKKKFSQTIVDSAIQWAKQKGWNMQRKSENKLSLKRGK